MLKKFTNFVLNKLQKSFMPLNRTNEGVRTIRYPRLRKFRNKGNKLLTAVKIVTIWYLLIITGMYLTTDTGAYFNDVEKISGTVNAAQDFCGNISPSSDYWQKYCKDNAGKGNGSEPRDEDSDEKGKDPDNPAQFPGGCDDHTNAPCSEAREIIVSHTNNSVNLTWKDPNLSTFMYTRVYRNGESTPIGDKIKNSKFTDTDLIPATMYSYIITTVDSSGNESRGVTIEVSTNP